MAGSGSVSGSSPVIPTFSSDPVKAIEQEKAWEAQAYPDGLNAPAPTTGQTDGFDPSTGQPPVSMPNGQQPTTPDGQPDPNASDPYATPPPPELSPEAKERLETLKQAKALQEGMEKGVVMNSMGGRFGGMPMRTDKVTRDQLKLMADNQSLPASSREAAEYFLKNDKAFDQAEQVNGGGKDGVLSLDDLDKTIKNLEGQTRADKVSNDPRLPAYRQALEVISKYPNDFDGAGGGVDNKISTKDFDKIANGDYPEDLKAAAKFMNDPANKDLLDLADTAKDGGDTDGVCSVDDINAMLDVLKNIPDPKPQKPQTVPATSFRTPISPR